MSMFSLSWRKNAIMTNLIWIAGAAGYYSALIIWITAQRTHHFHGRYSHSWMIGILLMLFGGLQILGSLSNSLILSTGLIALVMPIIVTTIDVGDHRREGRGLFEHKTNCWMEEKDGEGHRHVHGPSALTIIASKDENWSSR